MADVKVEAQAAHSNALAESLKTETAARSKRLSLHLFWDTRNSGNLIWLDRVTVNALAPPLAYAGYRLRVTPNQLSLASGLCAVAAFVAGLILPTDRPISSIVLLYLLVQLSYAFDCADGLLARVVQAETKFGEFLDKSVDATTGMLSYGGVFAYMFRYHSALGEEALANLVLVCGFLFIVARFSRFFALSKFTHMFRFGDEPNSASLSRTGQALLSFMDAQASAMGLLLFLFTSVGALVFYACQSLILSAVYLRYFRRAYVLELTDQVTFGSRTRSDTKSGRKQE